jgi:pentatricopeptide repeat protein
MCARRGELERAFSLFRDAQQCRVQLTHELWTIMIRACAQRRDYYPEALQLLHEMQSDGWEPTTTTFGALLEVSGGRSSLASVSVGGPDRPTARRSLPLTLVSGRCRRGGGMQWALRRSGTSSPTMAASCLVVCATTPPFSRPTAARSSASRSRCATVAAPQWTSSSMIFRRTHPVARLCRCCCTTETWCVLLLDVVVHNLHLPCPH